MTLFWIAALVLIAIASLFIVWPFMQKQANNDDVLRDELNKAFYKDRLSELEEETQEGLVEDKNALIAELKQSLLDDIPAERGTLSGSTLSAAKLIVPSLVLLIAVSVGFYAWLGSYSQVSQWQNIANNLPELSKKLMNPQGVALTDEEMEDLTLALRTRLYYEPDDATGWLLLGRIALANRDMHTSIGAMKKAYELKPADVDIQFGYAQALIMSQDEMDQDQARTILTRLSQREYVDLRVFSLLAFDAFERQDFANAIDYWKQMQVAIGPKDARYDMLTRSIDSAQRQMKEAKEGSHAQVTVTVELADTVRLPSQGVVIVSVHTPDGAPMPVAASRYPLGAFPLTITLDDSNSMIQGRKISGLDHLIVRARIDSDGNVSTREGDWYGESDAVKLGDPVDVIIDKQY